MQQTNTYPYIVIQYLHNDALCLKFGNVYIKAAGLQNILMTISYKNFKIYLQIYKVVVRNKKTPTYFHCFTLKTDNSLFCHRDIPTIHNGYCVRNAVHYAKKNDVLPTIFQMN